MIEQPQALPLLVDACPSFRQSWENHLQEFGNDVQYIPAGHLADHLLALHRAGREEVFGPLAAAIERPLIEGSSWVKEFATVGVLESIQNVWGNAGADLHVLTQNLGPEGRRQWELLIDFWSDASGNPVGD
ncbi:hypothetical protein ABB26_11190 [Stenotrophomonas humi]|uniref:DUF7674 domain-containing protein n=1 Tax=Stenotrophomonas humi TaxID=405444 RepID=A0A0R0CAR5_9GAMM|nr:hypothetical protein [Stenotrophomonas humi]KRG63762.1 hypothetical protein ABB26_11190 [Stenotrophomonas humi]